MHNSIALKRELNIKLNKEELILLTKRNYYVTVLSNGDIKLKKRNSVYEILCGYNDIIYALYDMKSIDEYFQKRIFNV